MSASAANQSTGRKLKRRGLVLTGGGVKGLYEAGVIHALHISGMEFDVITGSSIGAVNSVFFPSTCFENTSFHPMYLAIQCVPLIQWII